MNIELVLIGVAFTYCTGAWAFAWKLYEKLADKLAAHIEWDLKQHEGIQDLKRRVAELEKDRGTPTGA